MKRILVVGAARPVVVAMRALLVLLVVAVALFVSSDAGEAYNAARAVWPRPRSIAHPEGAWFWRLHPASLQVVFAQEGPHWDAVHEILSQAEQRYANLIPVAATARQEREGVPGRVVGVASQIHVSIMDPSTVLDLQTDESYTLVVSLKTGIRVVADTVFGVLRGLETFAQLVEPRAGVVRLERRTDDGAGVQAVMDPGTRFYVECVQVDDAPAYPYRGIMIDTARHYLPVPVIERMLDAMVAGGIGAYGACNLTSRVRRPISSTSCTGTCPTTRASRSSRVRCPSWRKRPGPLRWSTRISTVTLLVPFVLCPGAADDVRHSSSPSAAGVVSGHPHRA